MSTMIHNGVEYPMCFEGKYTGQIIRKDKCTIIAEAGEILDVQFYIRGKVYEFEYVCNPDNPFPYFHNINISISFCYKQIDETTYELYCPSYDVINLAQKI